MKTLYKLEISLVLGTQKDLDAWAQKMGETINVSGGMPAYRDFQIISAQISSDDGPFEGNKTPEFKLASSTGGKRADPKQDPAPRGRDKVSERPG
jgi:hypothetical protein